MGKFISITLKLPEEVHRKLKVASALSNKSMTQIIIDFVEKMKVTTPDFMQTGEEKKTIKPMSVENTELKELILSLKAEGLTLQGIADSLDAEGIPTARGGKWFKGTIANMLKRWEKETTRSEVDNT